MNIIILRRAPAVLFFVSCGYCAIFFPLLKCYSISQVVVGNKKRSMNTRTDENVQVKLSIFLIRFAFFSIQVSCAR
ncbi:hypothetical protein NS303_18935 [Pantoea ananatis]|nr:hypothetical protein NS303_18935 [Pantoea ananatis]KTR54813.1 hypothetical protein NS311_15355 [Pantoea ananatis]KTR65290.1 hypothetical protein RSA47_10355 [Pantoea ananatis]KTR68888.1 hypothetical protein NS296_16565 [Pantoea ananatis]PZD67055.1 hypothetical protein ARC310_04640 [Pantoea ananatis]